VVVGVPLGVTAHRHARLGVAVLALVGLLQTVPSLALLAFLIALMGTIGFAPALVALFLYALLPIVRNTQAGLAGVPAGLPEAARALSVNPGLLLLDEPFVSLDRAMVRDLQALFLKVFQAGNPTVVIVTHDPEDAARIAARAVVLRGRPAQITADVTLSGTPGQRSAADIARVAGDLSDVRMTA